MNLGDIEKEDPSRQRQILSNLILQTFDTLKVIRKTKKNSEFLDFEE